jgi:hypothetical protein
MARVSKVGYDLDTVVDEIMHFIPASLDPNGLVRQPWFQGFIKRMLFTAEDTVERDLDILISRRKVYCIEDQTFEPPEEDAMVLYPLDKPVNWFAGHRRGALRLPKGFVKQLYSLKLRMPYNFASNTPNFDIPVSGPQKAVVLQRNTISISPAGFAGWWPGVSYAAFNDGVRIPSGIDVVFEAGLSKRELENDWQGIYSLILLQTALGMLVELQPQVGEGAQKETLQQDSLMNAIEYAKRDAFGALGGDIKALAKRYDTLVNSLRANQLSWIYA